MKLEAGVEIDCKTSKRELLGVRGMLENWSVVRLNDCINLLKLTELYL